VGRIVWEANSTKEFGAYIAYVREAASKSPSPKGEASFAQSGSLSPTANFAAETCPGEGPDMP